MGAFFVFSFESTLFLVLFELIVAGAGLFLFFAMMDRSLQSEEPAILKMAEWLKRHRGPPALPDRGLPPVADGVAALVVDTQRAVRAEDGAVVAPLRLQSAEAREGCTRAVFIDGERVEFEVPGGTTPAHELRLPDTVRNDDGSLTDLVLDVDVVS